MRASPSRAVQAPTPAPLPKRKVLQLYVTFISHARQPKPRQLWPHLRAAAPDWRIG